MKAGEMKSWVPIEISDCACPSWELSRDRFRGRMHVLVLDSAMIGVSGVRYRAIFRYALPWRRL